ncbi:unnamed protein product [Choristocarpus tenellus]
MTLARILGFLAITLQTLGGFAHDIKGCLTAVEDSNYRCGSATDTILDLSTCGLEDDDMDAIRACIETRGVASITKLYLHKNKLRNLKEGLFLGMSSLKQLEIDHNHLSTVPKEIFYGLGELHELFLHSNALTHLPNGVFEGLLKLEALYLHQNALTTLPKGIFADLPALGTLLLGGQFDGNLNLQCRPDVNGPKVFWPENGSETGTCGCELIDYSNYSVIISNMCGSQVCTPGTTGYECTDEPGLDTDMCIPLGNGTCTSKKQCCHDTNKNKKAKCRAGRCCNKMGKKCKKDWHCCDGMSCSNKRCVV